MLLEGLRDSVTWGKNLRVRDRTLWSEWSTGNKRLKCRVSSRDGFTYRFENPFSPVLTTLAPSFAGWLETLVDYLHVVLFEIGDPSVIKKSSEYM